MDFPPEIRNMIYELLLIPEDTGVEQMRAVRHPLFLASCKQVHAEAADMLATLYQNISVRLDFALRCHIGSTGRSTYHVEVTLNRSVLGKGRQGDRALTLSWPISLRKLRYLNINVHMFPVGLCVPAASQLSDREFTQIRCAGESQINHGLYDLYRFLGKDSRFKQIDVMTASMLSFTSRYREELLSPACAIASLAKKSRIHGYRRPFRIRHLHEPMQNVVDIFRDIRDLEQEVMLHDEPQDGLPSKPPDSTGSLLSKPSFRSNILALYELLTSLRHYQFIHFTYAVDIIFTGL
jgi:hypothetical protein